SLTRQALVPTCCMKSGTLKLSASQSSKSAARPLQPCRSMSGTTRLSITPLVERASPRRPLRARSRNTSSAGLTPSLGILPFGRLRYCEPECERGSHPPRNDRPRRLFQDHGLDLCQTVRGLASAIYLDKPA